MLQEESRRFKIKLSPSENATSVEICRQCITVLSSFITFKEMNSQSNEHDNSLMDSQSLLDCSSQLSQQQPLAVSPARNTATTDSILHTMETRSLAKVRHQK